MRGTDTSTRNRLWAWVVAGLLVVLWAAAAVPLTLDAARVVGAHTTTRLLGEPVDAVVVQMQEERRLSAGYLAEVVERDALASQRRRTDEACRHLREAADGSLWRTTAGSRTARPIDELVRRLDDRGALRAGVDGGRSDVDAVVSGYSGIIAAAFAGAPWLWPDSRSDRGSALLALGRARESLSQQDAVLTGDPRGAATARVRANVVPLSAARRVLLAEAADRLPDTARRRYDTLAAEPATARLLAWEDRLLVTAPAAGESGLDAYRTRLREIEAEGVRQARREAVPGAVITVGAAGLITGVGLLAVIAVLLRLRRTVATAERAGSGTTSPAMPGANGTMLELALEQNRRNQALLHRLLRMLDHLQRRVGDDGTLGELFRIDHLASRVRRNVEKTTSLTGGAPGRQWTTPVPVTEVVRAAASEVPDFERVSTAQVEPVALAGTAVVDVMHLLAELIENAVTFSPAETRVRVGGEWTADDYVLTVADHGPGMTDEDLRVAADVLAATEPPATRAWDGLYAAGRLADRYGIGVLLRNGGTGGLVAEVTVPADLLSTVDPSADHGEPQGLFAGPPVDEASEPAPTAVAPRVPRQRAAQRLRPGAAPTRMRPDPAATVEPPSQRATVEPESLTPVGSDE